VKEETLQQQSTPNRVRINLRLIKLNQQLITEKKKKQKSRQRNRKKKRKKKNKKEERIEIEREVVVPERCRRKRE